MGWSTGKTRFAEIDREAKADGSKGVPAGRVIHNLHNHEGKRISLSNDLHFCTWRNLCEKVKFLFLQLLQASKKVGTKKRKENAVRLDYWLNILPCVYRKCLTLMEAEHSLIGRERRVCSFGPPTFSLFLTLKISLWNIQKCEVSRKGRTYTQIRSVKSTSHVFTFLS